MLEVGRVERGAAQREIRQVDLSELLLHCAETVCLRYRVPLQTVELQTAPCLVTGSKVDLDMIFRNLIDNAVKYAGQEPKVTVKVELLPGDRVAIMITDNGPGIPKQLRRKIFGRFVRLGSELEREKLGTGLGLHIVRTLVRRHRGMIRVHDGPGGVGTVFEVELPEARPIAPRPEASAEERLEVA
jgi:signal transduction histidine kinase